MKCQVCNSKLHGGNFCIECGAPAPIKKESSALGILAVIFCSTYFLGFIGMILAIVDVSTKDGKKKNLSVIALSLFVFFMFLTNIIYFADTFEQEIYNAFEEQMLGIGSDVEEIYIVEDEVGEYGIKFYDDDGDEKIMYLLPEGTYTVENNGWAGNLYVKHAEGGSSITTFLIKGQESEVKVLVDDFIHVNNNADLIFTLKEEE